MHRQQLKMNEKNESARQKANEKEKKTTHNPGPCYMKYGNYEVSRVKIECTTQSFIIISGIYWHRYFVLDKL